MNEVEGTGGRTQLYIKDVIGGRCDICGRGHKQTSKRVVVRKYNNIEVCFNCIDDLYDVSLLDFDRMVKTYGTE